MPVFARSYRDERPAINPQVSQADRDFLSEAFERFRLSQSAEDMMRRDALDDLKFVAGDQWPDDVKAQRGGQESRPCLTMNRLRPFLRMVTNEQRQQRPGIQINPVGDDADIETAQTLQGIIRHIENLSDAEIAYDTGFAAMVTGGFGYWRLINQYIAEDSDEQEILIKEVANCFTVYYDPRAIERDRSDAMYCFIIEDMAHERYRAEYPNSAMASLLDFTSIGDQHPGWLTQHGVRVAEYYWVELTKGPYKPKKKIHWAKINAIEIVDEEVVPGSYIPVVPVLGDEVYIDGKRQIAGLIRDAKDPQRVYNYQISAACEAVALAPKAPFIVAEGQTENHDTEWALSNRRNFATLTYKPVSLAGQPLPPPQRNTAEPPIQAMAAIVRQADNDLKSTTGIYDASLGQQGPEQSGKAVLLRQRQSDIANLNFTDNMARSIRHTARIIISQIPEVYDRKRVQRIIKPDGTAAYVGVWNSQNESQPELAEFGAAIQKIYDVGVGRYDVTVSVGPSYQSKRQEGTAAMMALVQSYPPIMQVAGDILLRNMDWPFAQEIAQRLKVMLPPAIQKLDAGDPSQQLQQMQQQMQQMQQQLQLLSTVAQHQSQIISQKLVEQQGKENIALIDQQTKLNVARISASKDRDTAGADREQDMIQTMMTHAHEQGMQSADQAHEAAMSQMPQQAGGQLGAAPPAPPTPGAPPQQPQPG